MNSTNLKVKGTYFCTLGLGVLFTAFVFFVAGSTTQAQTISHFAGGGTNSSDGVPASSCRLHKPSKVRADQHGNIYIASFAQGKIRKIDSNGIITSVAGNTTSSYSGDGGQATAAGIGGPENVSIDNAGNMYIAQMDIASIVGDTLGNTFARSWVRKVGPSGIITRFAGNGSIGLSAGDGGPATAATFQSIVDAVPDNLGNIYIVDEFANLIRKVDASGIVTTIAGGGSALPGDGGPATAAMLGNPNNITVDGAGNIYFTEYNNKVRKVNTAGILSTVAGNGAHNYYGDGGPATAAELALPLGVALDDNGNIFIADRDNFMIRVVDPSGIIYPYAGNGIPGNTGDGGPAISAELTAITGICTDPAGNLFVVNSDTEVVRKITPIPAGIKQFNPDMSARITPDPNDGNFTITIPSAVGTPARIVVTNALGQCIREINTYTNQKTEVQLNVAPGIYFVTSITGRERQTAKIIVR